MAAESRWVWKFERERESCGERQLPPCLFARLSRCEDFCLGVRLGERPPVRGVCLDRGGLQLGQPELCLLWVETGVPADESPDDDLVRAIVPGYGRRRCSGLRGYCTDTPRRCGLGRRMCAGSPQAPQRTSPASKVLTLRLKVVLVRRVPRCEPERAADKRRVRAAEPEPVDRAA